MSDRTAKTIVLLAGAFMFAAIGLKRDTISDPFRYAWGAGVITLLLTVVADISPEVAGPFALLVLVAVYAKNRNLIGPVLTSPPSSGRSSSSSSSGSGQTNRNVAAG